MKAFTRCFCLFIALALSLSACGILPLGAKTPTPVPTLRRFPTATPTPTPTPLPQETLFEEDFSGEGGYLGTYQAEDGTSAYANGAYQISMAPGYNYNYVYGATFGQINGSDPQMALSDPALANVSLDVDVLRTSGASNAAFGAMCGVKAANEFYAFFISSDARTYVIGQDTPTTALTYLGGQEWGKPSSAIHTGEGAVNHIRVECGETFLSLSVNGEKLAEVPAPQAPAGGVGLAAYTRGRGPFEVAFDNLAVKKLAEIPDQASLEAVPSILYQDNFSDPASGWLPTTKEENLGLLANYENGALVVTLDPRTSGWSLAAPTMGHPSLRAEVDMTLEEDLGNAYMGLGCDRLTAKDHFNFLADINPQGYYAITYSKNESGLRSLVDWTQSGYIILGLGQPNHVRLDCAPDKLTLYINQEKVQEVDLTDVSGLPAEYQQEAVIVTAHFTYHYGEAKASFDNFTLRKP